METILNYLHFERRQDTSVFENQINEYINSDKLDHQAKAFFTIQLIRYLQQVKVKYILTSYISTKIGQTEWTN